MLVTVQNEMEMEILGQKIATIVNKNDVIYIRGNLGAGKTTLVRGIAHGLGYSGRVTSPTFAILNIYPTEPVMYHFDFYRLQETDMEDLGLDEYFERDGVCIVEWPQVGNKVLPTDALVIDIDLIDDDYEKGRLVKIAAQGTYYMQKLKELAEQYAVASNR